MVNSPEPTAEARIPNPKRMLKGYNMAAEEVNSEGGVLGRPVELIWRDEQAKPDVAVREARDLVFGEKVDYLIGCFITSTTNAVSTFAKENKVLFMGSGVGVALTEEDGHRYFFRLSANSTMMAKAMSMLVQRKGYKKVWIIAPDYAFGHQWVNDGKVFLKELIPGVQLAGENFTPLGEKDFGPYIADMSRGKPDVVFSVLFGRDAGVVEAAEPELSDVQGPCAVRGEERWERGVLGVAVIGGRGPGRQSWGGRGRGFAREEVAGQGGRNQRGQREAEARGGHGFLPSIGRGAGVRGQVYSLTDRTQRCRCS